MQIKSASRIAILNLTTLCERVGLPIIADILTVGLQICNHIENHRITATVCETSIVLTDFVLKVNKCRGRHRLIKCLLKSIYLELVSLHEATWPFYARPERVN